MKRLIFMRHAEASYQTDNDRLRPLTARGTERTILMSRLLADNGYAPQLIISSDAKRAQQTAQTAIGQMPATPRLSCTPLLYGNYTTQQLIDAIVDQSRPEDDTIMIIAHNPELSARASQLSQNSTSMFNTSDAVVLTFNIDKWDDLTARTGHESFRTPFMHS